MSDHKLFEELLILLDPHTKSTLRTLLNKVIEGEANNRPEQLLLNCMGNETDRCRHKMATRIINKMSASETAAV